MIKWGHSHKMAVRITSYDGKGWNRYWNLKEHVLQDDKAIRKTIGKYTAKTKIFAIQRDKDKNYSANGGGWTNSETRMKTYSTHDQAMRDVQSKKLEKVRIVLIER